MRRSLDDYVSELRPRLERLVRALEAAGYVFANPAEVLPGPRADVGATIASVERVVGALPAALSLFYRRVGSVDLTGTHPAWHGCDYPDPLVIYPVSAVLEEARQYAELEDPKEEYGASETGVFRAPIAPDPLHKANVSGGMWYGVEVPSSSRDPIVLEERHGLPFTEYLELALRWGGFPGLAAAPKHSWPIERLREAAAPVPE
jgi:hypothetical protein